MLLIAYDQIRTHGNEEDKFYRRQWDTLFDKLEKSVYPVKDSTILHDFYTSIQQSVQLLGYQPERQ